MIVFILFIFLIISIIISINKNKLYKYLNHYFHKEKEERRFSFAFTITLKRKACQRLWKLKVENWFRYALSEAPRGAKVGLACIPITQCQHPNHFYSHFNLLLLSYVTTYTIHFIKF